MRRSWQRLALIIPLAFLASAAHSAEFQIVAHPSVEGSQIRRSVLAGIYHKDVIRWGDRRRILPVDQSGQTPIRQAFAREVLGQSLGEIQEYWIERMTMDRELPPPAKPSDHEVLAFVASRKGAIGYVSGELDLPPDVKRIALID